MPRPAFLSAVPSEILGGGCRPDNVERCYRAAFPQHFVWGTTANNAPLLTRLLRRFRAIFCSLEINVRAKDLKKLLEKVDNDAVVVRSIGDHSYSECDLQLATGLYDGYADQ